MFGFASVCCYSDNVTASPIPHLAAPEIPPSTIMADNRIRKRHTFLFPEDDPNVQDGFDFSSSDDAIKIIGDLDVPRQDRLTIPIDKVPLPLQSSLKNGSKFLITYSRNSPYFDDVPFTLVSEPGWHVMIPEDELFSDIDFSDTFKLHENLDNSAITTPNWRSVCVDGDISYLGGWIKNLLTTGLSSDEAEKLVDSIDSISITSGFLPLHPLDFQKETDIVIDAYISRAKKGSIAHTGDFKTEIGLFTVSSSYSDFEDHDWALGGLIRNMDKKDFDKSLIHAWPRHPKATGSLDAAFDQPVGLHPHHRLYFNDVAYPSGHASGTCRLYAEYTVPKFLFLDQYQLADLDRRTETSIPTGKLIGVWGEIDLEAPVWAIDGWGSEALVEIYHDKSGTFDFELPLHSRYEIPLNGSTQLNHRLPWPAVFWACQDMDMRPSPDIKSLGYETFFPDDTVFYHVGPRDAVQSFNTEFHIPVAPLEHYDTIRKVTTASLLAGFAWILWKVFSKNARDGKENATSRKKE